MTLKTSPDAEGSTFDRFDADDIHEDSVWKTSYIDDLPDSAFLYIEAGGEKDSSGKTTPRTLRHFPVRDAEGRLDLVHVRAAIDMAPKANVPAHVIQDVQARARMLLSERGAHHHPSRMDEGDESRVDTFLRLDASKVERTPQGGVKLPGSLTKVGVFPYRRKDGTTIKEYRPASEVMDAQSIASLENAPVTDLHPTEMVDSANYSKLSKGHVRDAHSDGKKYIIADTVVQDAALAAKVLGRTRTEISCGYRCKLDMTPGVFEGQKYDAIQRNIRYNHVALLPAGTGRQGTDVALRFDACQDEHMVLRYDGKDYDVSDSAERNAYEAAVSANAKAEADKALATAKAEADKALATVTARADAAEGSLAAVTAELAPLKAEKALAVRTALEAQAKKTLGEDAKFDAKDTDRQVMERVLTAKGISFAGKTDDYVRACFDMIDFSAQAAIVTDPALAAGLAALQPPGKTLVNAPEPNPNSLTERWKLPLTRTKGQK